MGIFLFFLIFIDFLEMLIIFYKIFWGGGGGIFGCSALGIMY